MYIAIDDTHGVRTDGKSRYVTGNRKTHVAVRFADAEVDHVRSELTGCLRSVSAALGRSIHEFHFSNIYNRRGEWSGCKDDLNLRVFDFFAEIYSAHRWPVMLQTIDDRTFSGREVTFPKQKIDGLKLRDRSDLSLVVLCLRIGHELARENEALTLLVDQRSRRPGTPFGDGLFRRWPRDFNGRYVSSTEPLIQIADFVAFCINRSTILQLKPERSRTDFLFLKLVEAMQLNTTDLQFHELPPDFTLEAIDDLHRLDRIAKGLERSFDAVPIRTGDEQEGSN